MAIFTGNGIRLEFRDLGLANLLARYNRMGQTEIRVGVVGAKAHETTADGRLTNAENAVIQAQGLGGAPRRDFINKPFVKSRARVAQILRRAATRALRSRGGASSVQDDFHVAGAELAQIPREAIMDFEVPPANRPSTVKKKGFNHPLVDHLDLFNSISYRLVNDGGISEAGSVDYDSFEISANVNPNAGKVGGGE